MKNILKIHVTITAQDLNLSEIANILKTCAPFFKNNEITPEQITAADAILLPVFASWGLHYKREGNEIYIIAEQLIKPHRTTDKHNLATFLNL
jgi:hypothetical protein